MTTHQTDRILYPVRYNIAITVIAIILLLAYKSYDTNLFKPYKTYIINERDALEVRIFPLSKYSGTETPQTNWLRPHWNHKEIKVEVQMHSN